MVVAAVGSSGVLAVPVALVQFVVAVSQTPLPPLIAAFVRGLGAVEILLRDGEIRRRTDQPSAASGTRIVRTTARLP